MKIVVIGAGKIGKTIVEHTCQEGHEVVVVDSDIDSTLPVLYRGRFSPFT